MSTDQVDLIDEARRSLEAAELLLNTGHPDFAASRAFYSMFYLADAFLKRDGLKPKRSNVIAAFERTFVATGRVPTP